jgi:RNA polymerase sigma-70 factor (ECF subfamily)
LYQEIALQLWRSMDRYQGDAKVSTWIYQVALNTAMAWSRQDRKQSKKIDGPPSRSPDTPAGIAESGERLNRLYAEIHKLPEMKRSLVLLYLEGLSYKEMAGILGISESNVGVQLNRTKRFLSELVKGWDDES